MQIAASYSCRWWSLLELQVWSDQNFEAGEINLPRNFFPLSKFGTLAFRASPRTTASHCEKLHLPGLLVLEVLDIMIASRCQLAHDKLASHRTGSMRWMERPRHDTIRSPLATLQMQLQARVVKDVCMQSES